MSRYSWKWLVLEQAQRDSREKHNDTENELRDPQKDELSPRKQKAHPEIRDVDYVSVLKYLKLKLLS